MEDYQSIFQRLWQHEENEVVEYKKASNSYDFEKLGKYFSALSNEANLRGVDFAWMVMGVWDKTHTIEGTSYLDSEALRNKMKQDISYHTTDNQTFREIMPIEVEGKRVLVMKIPATPRNIVMKWKGIAYGRNGESLEPLNQQKQDEIRQQDPIPDWSAELVEGVSISDLDELALAKARVMYKKVHSKISGDVIDSWSMEEFLGRSEVMRDGKLTRAAVLLLGKPGLEIKIKPAVAQITWTLYNEENRPVDYEHFGVPFLLTVDDVLSRIRNLTMRELPGGTLFPDVMRQYDEYSIREALHNAIAHQDYRLQQRVVLVERPNCLYYANGGSFIPGTIDDALEAIGPQRHYRNECLCNAMVHFNMIDTIGRGIKTIFDEQKKRFFPMPDYDIDRENCSVAVTIYGKMIDEKYTNLLKSETGKKLTLRECIMLDAVQKGRTLPNDGYKYLKDKGLIVGKGKHYHISEEVAKMTRQLGKYVHDYGVPSDDMKLKIMTVAKKAGLDGFKRKDAYEAIQNLLPTSNEEKDNLRITGYLLIELAKEGKLHPEGKKWFVGGE